jgi:hypothetical protein
MIFAKLSHIDLGVNNSVIMHIYVYIWHQDGHTKAGAQQRQLPSLTWKKAETYVNCCKIEVE